EVIVGIDGKMQMLGGRGGESSGQSQGGQSGWGQPQQPARQPQQPQQAQPADWSKQNPDGEWIDDIPFAPIGLPYPRNAIYVI
nr:single-stranded DNA-binding protein [Providencia stuartii]